MREMEDDSSLTLPEANNAPSEMMERVARAIAEKLAGREVSLGVPRIAPTGPVTITVDLVDVARAALRAMRATTAPMLRAGHRPLLSAFAEEANAYGAAARVYDAMISAALSEDTKP